MTLFIVPDSLRDAINAKLDEAYKAVPKAAADRDLHYAQLLDAFNRLGRIPEFSLKHYRDSE